MIQKDSHRVVAVGICKWRIGDIHKTPQQAEYIVKKPTCWTKQGKQLVRCFYLMCEYVCMYVYVWLYQFGINM